MKLTFKDKPRIEKTIEKAATALEPRVEVLPAPILEKRAGKMRRKPNKLYANAGLPEHAKWTPTKSEIEKIEMLYGVGCTQDEVAYNLRIDPRTLKRRLAEEREALGLSRETDPADYEPPIDVDPYNFYGEGIPAIIVCLERGRSTAVGMVKKAFFEKSKEGSFAHGAMFLNNVPKEPWIGNRTEAKVSGTQEIKISLTPAETKVL